MNTTATASQLDLVSVPMAMSNRVCTRTASVTVMISMIVMLIITQQVHSAPIPIAEITHEGPVHFEKEIKPILQRNCLACHSRSKPESDLVLETLQSIRKGGALGPAVVPGEPDQSLLLLVAAHREEPEMPPSGNTVNARNLTPEELGLLRLWILEGAKGTETLGGDSIAWKSLPSHQLPVFAAALTQDGQLAAAGRGNRITIDNIASRDREAVLIDAQLQQISGFENDPRAHLDMVQSLAFHPDGNLLASGGFREVKFWKRPQEWPLQVVSKTLPTANRLAVSPDQSKVVVASILGELQIISLSTLTSGPRWSGHQGGISGLEFTSDSRSIITSGFDGTIRRWDAESGKGIAAVTASDAITAMTLVKSRQQILIALSNGTMQLINIPQPRADAPSSDELISADPIQEFPAAGIPIQRMVIADPLGTQVAAASADGFVRLWDLQEGKQTQIVHHGAPVSTLAVCPDGAQLVTGSDNGLVKVWNIQDGSLLFDFGHPDPAERDLARMSFQIELVERALTTANSDVREAEKEFQQQQDQIWSANIDRARVQADLAKKETPEETARSILETANRNIEKARQNAAAAEEQLQAARIHRDDLIQKLITARLALQQRRRQLDIEAQAIQELRRDRQEVDEWIAQFKLSLQNNPPTDALIVAAATPPGAEEAEARNAARLAQDRWQEARMELARIEDQSKQQLERLTLEQEFSRKAVAELEDELKSTMSRKEAAAQELAAAEQSSSEGTESDPIKSAERDNARERLHWLETQKEQGQQRLSQAVETLNRIEAELKKTQEEAQEFSAAAKNQLGEAETNWKSARQLARQFVAARGGDLALLEAAERLQKIIDERLSQLSPRVTSLSYSPDGRRLLVADLQSVRMYSTATGTQIHRQPVAVGFISGEFRNRREWVGLDQQGQISLLNVLPDWELDRQIGSVNSPDVLAGPVTALAFSPDGSILATGSGETSRFGEIRLWDASTGELIGSIENIHSDLVLGLAFSRDGTYLASASADRFMRVFNVQTREQVKSFEGHTNHVLAVSWRADGRLLATGGGDNTCRLWNFKSGEPVRTYTGYAKEVTGVQFFGASDQLVTSSGGAPRVIRRDVSGDKTLEFSGPTEFLHCIQCSDDGRIVVAGGEAGLLHVWNNDATPLINFPAEGP